MLLHKRSHALTYLDPNRRLVAFESRKPVVDLSWKEFPAVDRELWSGFVERASRAIKRYDEIKDSSVEFQAEHTCRLFINSEVENLDVADARHALQGPDEDPHGTAVVALVVAPEVGLFDVFLVVLL